MLHVFCIETNCPDGNGLNSGARPKQRQKNSSYVLNDKSERSGLIMHVDVSTEIVIARPLPEVCGYAANPDNAPTWYRNIRKVEWKTTPPMRIGSRIGFVANFLGRQLSYTYEIVWWVPNEQLVMQTSNGPFPMQTTYLWQSASQGTRMILRNRGTPVGFSKLVTPFLTFVMRAANRADLKRLKQLLEERRTLEGRTTEEGTISPESHS
jgi:Polyketide cyclase / dehydrase and lipid transport